MIDACAAFGVDWIECPIIETTDTIEEIYALRRHANKFGMRLAGLEKATSLDAFAPFLSAGAYDVIMPDVKYLGGLALFAELAEMAQRQGAAISPHNPSGPVSHAASIHVSAVVSGFDSLEHQFDETPHFNKLVGDSGVPTQEGKARLPSKPGLGVSLDEGLLDRLRLEEPSGVRNAP